jgi:hypothetical protein
MRFLINIVLLFILFQSSANGALIEYQFDTLTFSDARQINGAFTYDTKEQKLVALSVSLFDSSHNISFDINDLSAREAFSVRFDNSIFGDSANEGFSLSKEGTDVETGQWGYGTNDTCYYYDDDKSCTNSLFTMTAVPSSEAVDAPKPAYFFMLGLVLLCGRRVFN